MIGPTLTGFASGFSLILAIGAQNSFVLRQGLTKNHVLPIVLFCSIFDAILIVLGVAGFGYIVQSAPWLPPTMAALGAAFLFVYGAMRFLTAFRSEYEMELTGQSQSLAKSMATITAFSVLNPHVYLDTLALLGAISTQFVGADKLAFGLGAVIASFGFFFSLGYGARLLAPIMQNARSWVVLDYIIGSVMWVLAFYLAQSIWSH